MLFATKGSSLLPSQQFYRSMPLQMRNDSQEVLSFPALPHSTALSHSSYRSDDNVHEKEATCKVSATQGDMEAEESELKIDKSKHSLDARTSYYIYRVTGQTQNHTLQPVEALHLLQAEYLVTRYSLQIT